MPVARAALHRWEGLLDRHGTRAVFLARLLPLARTFVSLPAGARRIRLGMFVALTTAGCALWALAFVLTGVFVGAAWTTVDSVGGRVLLVVGLLTLALTLLRRRRSSHGERRLSLYIVSQYGGSL